MFLGERSLNCKSDVQDNFGGELEVPPRLKGMAHIQIEIVVDSGVAESNLGLLIGGTLDRKRHLGDKTMKRQIIG